MIARAGGAPTTTAMTDRSGALLIAYVGVVRLSRRGSMGWGEAGIRVPNEAGAVETSPADRQKFFTTVYNYRFSLIP